MVVVLHGVTGESTDYYIQELAQHCTLKGLNVVSVNHYGVTGGKNLRLMDFTKQKHLDEVIEYCQSRFNNGKGHCDIFLVGFSLGGNHVMRYVGAA